jgi:tRNA1Val (adenine37-N6)-methyltransferase
MDGVKTTCDTIFGGRVVVHQAARGHGYRVNADALLLADFAGRANGPLYDLGAGVGAVALVMIARGFATRAVLVDVDQDSCELAKTNVDDNHADATIVCGDVLDVAGDHAAKARVVVCNPPYWEPGTARVRRSQSRARVGDVDRFVRAARRMLGHRGRACFVYPAAEVARLFATLRAHGFEPKRLRFVHPTGRAPARVVLLEARATKPGGLVLLAPLIERDGPSHGAYTEEAARALGLR